jgi:hypothetical protein
MKTRIEDAAKKYAIEDVFGDDTCKDFQSCITDFIAGAEFMQKETVNIMEAMTQTSQCNYKLKAQNEIMREALKDIKDFGYTQTDSDGHEIYELAQEALEKTKGEK